MKLLLNSSAVISIERVDAEQAKKFLNYCLCDPEKIKIDKNFKGSKIMLEKKEGRGIEAFEKSVRTKIFSIIIDEENSSNHNVAKSPRGSKQEYYISVIPRLPLKIIFMLIEKGIGVEEIW